MNSLFAASYEGVAVLGCRVPRPSRVGRYVKRKIHTRATYLSHLREYLSRLLYLTSCSRQWLACVENSRALPFATSTS